MRLSFNPNNLITPRVSDFGDFVMANKGKLTPKNFADEYGKLRRQYVRQQEKDLFNDESNQLVERLLNEQELDMAGIVISSLCKLNENSPEYLEYFAKLGYNLSKSKGDYVHMMARLNNLRKLYIDKQERLFEYIQVLYDQERCLKTLTQNYTDIAEKFCTLTRKISSKETYERMLGFVQTEIAKLVRRRHPEHALKKLISAQEIFTKSKDYRELRYVKQLKNDVQMEIESREVS